MWGRRILGGGCLLVMFLNCLYIKPKQTAAISSMQCEMLTVDVYCFDVMREGNRDLCDVTEQRGFFGR